MRLKDRVTGGWIARQHVGTALYGTPAVRNPRSAGTACRTHPWMRIAWAQTLWAAL